MPHKYERLGQEDESEMALGRHEHRPGRTAQTRHDLSLPASASAGPSRGSGKRMARSSVAVAASTAPAPRHTIDMVSLNAMFEHWTQAIAKKFRRRKRREYHEKPVISSVFVDPDLERLGLRDVKARSKTFDHGSERMTAEQFEAVVDSVKEAIERGIQPKLVSKGSSGSYFCRDLEGTIVGIFKPKDEEPYGQLNPKWTKWVHRNLFPCCFGRACLIPNLSYISEAAASLIDRRLETNIVPRTGLIYLSSPVFHYDWIDRRTKKPLPAKVGSFQVFLHGFQDATEFFRANPWPERIHEETFDESTFRHRQLRPMRSVRSMTCLRPSDEGEEPTVEDRPGSAVQSSGGSIFDFGRASPVAKKGFSWTASLMTEFREELEKLIILDYLMRNTDRGLDNWMIRSCKAKEDSSIKVDLASPLYQEQPGRNALLMRMKAGEARPASPLSDKLAGNTMDYDKAHMHVAAIDNSLSFPFKHPDAWRNYTYGWLYLPASLIGRPFSQSTRAHFLPLLSDPEWWAATTRALRKLFAIDPDFSQSMFERQMAVIKGQGWNIMECLKNPMEGPLELCRRVKILVVSEEVSIDSARYPAGLPADSMTVDADADASGHVIGEIKSDQIKTNVNDATTEDVTAATARSRDQSQGRRSSRPLNISGQGEDAAASALSDAEDEDDDDDEDDSEGHYGSSANASLLASRLRSRSLDGTAGRPFSARSRSDLGAQIRGVLRANAGSRLGGATSESQHNHVDATDRPEDLSKSAELARPNAGEDEPTSKGRTRVGGAAKVGAISGVAILENLDRFNEVQEEDEARARAALADDQSRLAADLRRTGASRGARERASTEAHRDVEGSPSTWRDKMRDRLSLDLSRHLPSNPRGRPGYGRSRTNVAPLDEEDLEPEARPGPGPGSDDDRVTGRRSLRREVGIVERLEVVKQNAFFDCI